MATFNAGAIEASLTLDRSSWNRDLKEIQAQFQELEQKSITITIDADSDNFMVAKDNVELFADDLDEKSITITADMDAEKFFQAAAQVELMIEQLSDMKIDVAATMDSSDFHAAAAQVELTTDALDQMSAEVGVGMDSTAFHAGAAQVELVSDILAQRSINIDVETTGVPKTLAELAELETAAEIVDGSTIHMNVDYDEGAFQKLVGSGGSGGGGGYMGFWQILIYAVIALLPILSVATSAAAFAIVAFSAALVGALGPLALLIGAIIVLIKQFKNTDPADYTKGMQALADAITQLKKVVTDLVDSGLGDVFFQAMATGVKTLTEVIKAVTPLLRPLGQLFNEVANSVYNFVRSKEFDGWLDFFGGFGLDMLKDFLSIGGNLIRFLMNLFIAIAPFARPMMQGLVKAFQDLVEWSSNLSNDQGFIDWANQALQYGPLLLDMLGEIFKAFLHIGDAIRPLAGPMIQGFTDIAVAIQKIPTDVLTQIIVAGAGLLVFFKVVLPLVGTLTTAFEALTAGLEGLALVLGVGLGPLILIIAAIAAAAAIIIYMWKNNEQFRKSLTDAWNDIKATVMPIIHDLVKMFKEEWPEIKKTAEDVWKSVQQIFQSAAGIIQQLVFFLTTAVTFIWKHFGDRIVEIIRNNLRGMLQIIRGAFQLIAGIFKFFDDLLHGRWSKLWGDLKQIVAGGWNIIKGLFRIAVGTLSGLMGIIGHALAMAWHGIWVGLKNAAQAGWGWIKDVFNSFVGWLKGIPGHINDALHGSFSGLLGDFRDVINTIIGWWNNLHFHIPGFNPPGPGSFGGMDVGVSQIPTLARGGLVDSPTLAWIGEGTEPEIVTPESKMAEIVRRFAGNQIDYNLLAAKITEALQPILGSTLTPEMVERILEQAGAHVNVDASNDDRSAYALAQEMAWQMRVLGYGGVAAG